MTFQRLRERCNGFALIHADAANGDDRTLCGYAYEGACTGEGDHGVEEIARGKINCASCLEIIWHSKDIPNRVLADRNLRRIVRATRS